MEVIVGKPGIGKTCAPLWRSLLGVELGDVYRARALEAGEALHRVRMLWDLYRLLQRKAKEAGLPVRYLALKSVRAEIRRQLGVLRRSDLQMGIVAARAGEVES